MARFILDVATDNSLTESVEVIEAVLVAIGKSKFEIASMTCINELNETQFHTDPALNTLIDEEINRFNNNPHC